jgi:hypothetical protein
MADNIYAKAADVLVEKGWCQGEKKNDEGNLCAIGALMEVEDDYLESKYAMDAAAERLAAGGEASAMRTGLLHPLARWNDRPERTAEDVILLFKELAAGGE